MAIVVGLLGVAFVALGVTIFRYLRSTSLLLERIEAHHPDLWIDLGEPRVVRLNMGHTTIQPIGPFLGWMLRPAAPGLDPELARMKERSRRLFRIGLVGLLAWALAFLVLAHLPIHFA